MPFGVRQFTEGVAKAPSVWLTFCTFANTHSSRHKLIKNFVVTGFSAISGMPQIEGT